jgi:ribose transport system ATP-binding protein
VTRDTGHDAFVERIIGRNLKAYSGVKSPLAAAPQVSVANLVAPGVGPVSLDIGRGEILGITGLIGSGFDHVPALLYGARPGTNGAMRLDGRDIDLASLTPETALSQGIAYLPADRLGEAGVGSLSVGDNVAMPVYDRLRGALGLTSDAIDGHAQALAAAAGVRPNVPALPLSALSGGNAQKALMAKWLQVKPRLLLLDEPTQGVDVGARQQIWDALDRAAADGASILIASTDYDQLAQICHRVLTFGRGRIVGTLSGGSLTKAEIAEQCYRSFSSGNS